VGCDRYGQHELLDFVPTNPGLRSDTPTHARTQACARTRMRLPTHVRAHCSHPRAPLDGLDIVCSYVPGIVDSGSSCLVLPDTMLQVSAHTGINPEIRQTDRPT
jgi:hypothetical protein